MQTSVQVQSEIQVRIEVEIPADKVARELDRQLGEFGKKARIRGFRPGKAPKDIVRKSYAGEIAAEATRRIINDSFKDAIDQVASRVVGEPQVEPGFAKQGEPLKYAIVAQVKPEVTVENWRGVEVAVAPVAAHEAEIERRLAALQDKQKERIPVDDRKSDTGDIIVINTTGFVNGERDTRLDMTAFEVKIGSGQLIPGFEDELVGLASGDKKGFDITFPENYGAPELAAAQARFEVEVTALFREEAPALDDDFAKDLGFADLNALREDTVAKILDEQNRRYAEETERKLIQTLLERNAFKVPPAMVEAFATERARGFLRMFRAQGLQDQHAMRFIEQNWQGLTASAEYEVRRSILLEAIAKGEGLSISDEEVAAGIAERTQGADANAAKIYERPEMLEGLKAALLEAKALTLLKESAVVTDVVAEAPEAEAAESAAE